MKIKSWSKYEQNREKQRDVISKCYSDEENGENPRDIMSKYYSVEQNRDNHSNTMKIRRIKYYSD